MLSKGWFNFLALDEVSSVNDQRSRYYLRIGRRRNLSWQNNSANSIFKSDHAGMHCRAWINSDDQHAAIKIYPLREKHEGVFQLIIEVIKLR